MRHATAFLALLTLSVLSVPALADVDIPDDWFGIWELSVDVYDCDSEVLLFSSTALDTICAGSVFQDPDPSSLNIECTASIDATTYTINCSGSGEAAPGCTANFVYEAIATLEGNSYVSVATSTISYEGDCFDIPDMCQRTEITGTRIGSAPDPCGSSPVESRSWSTVREHYR